MGKNSTMNMRSSCIARICSMLSFLHSWLFTVHCSPSGFQGPLLCAYINLWLTSVSGYPMVVDATGLLDPSLRSMIRMGFFHGTWKPRSRRCCLVRSLKARSDQNEGWGAIWSNYRFMRIYFSKHELILMHWVPLFANHFGAICISPRFITLVAT